LKWNLNGDVALEFGGMVSTSNRAMNEVVTVQASHPLVFTAEMTAGNRDNDTYV
jgi:thiamine pyrophosphokinase